jgi:hypothetical protein
LPGSAAAALLFALNAPVVLPRVIVLGNRLEARKVALAVGADAFVYKGALPDQLLTAYHALSAGIGDASIFDATSIGDG